MARKNWNKVAAQEFEAMDLEWQKDWGDLRLRVAGRS
jgi:hypothetical protein